MFPTSPTQFEWEEGSALPPLEEIRAGVWSLALGMPAGHIPYSLLYLIADLRGGVHVIDPGFDTDQNWQRITGALACLGFSAADVVSVTCTHLHPDHLGSAERFRAASGAPVAMLAAEVSAIEALNDPARSLPLPLAQLERWGVPADRMPELEPFRSGSASTTTLVPDVALRDGDVLPIPGRDIVVFATPGHTLGHLCLVDRLTGLVYTGDHVLPTMFPGIGLGGDAPTNAIADYLDSLDAITPFDDCEVLPGHGYRFRGLANRCADTAAHHLRRSREVQAALAADVGASLWQVAEQLTWTVGWQNLEGFYLLSALRQVDMHIAFVRSDRGRRRLERSAADG